ncbi:MAG: 16S rRNA (adenine(1518)-N(6)/adenine(1519)-N(6))-dimethyltransferase RsmA [Firmicutes bacterium]|nr:16S rRNA (adenine(1518)-N(6)/adenine(1519)-N(6))-dimethyltransferase RsmA [Bacillota bacterium]
MSPPSLTELLPPKKAFGQNFLVQESAIALILREALASPAPRILEIGPGPGTLTEGLLADGRPLWAMDLDPEAIACLQGRFAHHAHFHTLLGDAVKAPLPSGEPWSVVGNLPYNAATAILTRLLMEPIPWERMVLMFQLEVGQKLLGTPGSKEYGPLSVLAQACCRVTRLLKLGPGAFRPSPKVDSVVLRFEPRPEAPDYAIRKALLALLHRSFAHRRKTLANNWQGFLEPGEIQARLQAKGLAPSVRAEAVPVSTWVSWAGEER